jgi:hypothetical protein
MFASAHGNNLRQDRNCDLIRRDRAKVKLTESSPHTSLRTACGSNLLVDDKERLCPANFSPETRNCAPEN